MKSKCITCIKEINLHTELVKSVHAKKVMELEKKIKMMEVAEQEAVKQVCTYKNSNPIYMNAIKMLTKDNIRLQSIADRYKALDLEISKESKNGIWK